MENTNQKLSDIIRKTLYNYYLKIPQKNRSHDDYRAIFKQCLKDAVIDFLSIGEYVSTYSRLDFVCGENTPFHFIPRHERDRQLCNHLNTIVNQLAAICKYDAGQILREQYSYQQFAQLTSYDNVGKDGVKPEWKEPHENIDHKHITDIDSISFNSITNIKF